MNYSDYSIKIEEIKQVSDSGKSNPAYKSTSKKMQNIWENFLERFENDSLKAEAEQKGFILVHNQDMEEDVVAKYLQIHVPDASEELRNYIEENLYPFVVCLKL